MTRAPLDLDAIEASLRAVEDDFDRITADLSTTYRALDEDAIQGLLAGYRFLDELRERDLDLLARGNSALLLRLNCLVICRDPERDFTPDPSVDTALQDTHCAPEFRETERRFYDDRSPGGVRALMNYLADHRHPTIWRRAAGVYTQIVSAPQLYFEGNHRTGVLVMSHVLLRAGLPPFVLSTENASTYFEISSAIKGYRKRSFQAMRHLPPLQRRLAELLEKTSDPRFLIQGETQPDRAEGVN